MIGFHPHPATLGILAAALSVPAAAQTGAATDAEFEAALQATRVAPTPVAPPTRVTAGTLAGQAAQSGQRTLPQAARRKAIPLPPAGTIPAQFRGAPSGRTAFEAAREAIKRGELDPFAYAEQISGPLPLPPGARAIRCRIWGMDATYTLGREAAPEVARVYAGYAQGSQAGEKPDIRIRGGEILPANDMMRALLQHKHAGQRPENRKILAELTTYLAARGYEAKRDFVADMKFVPKTATVGRAAVALSYFHSPFYLIDICREAGLTMPTGPYVVAEPYFPEPER